MSSLITLKLKKSSRYLISPTETNGTSVHNFDYNILFVFSPQLHKVLFIIL